MSSLPNSHAALLKNQAQLTAPLALIGLSDPALLSRLPAPGTVVCDHYGAYQNVCSVSGWQPLFGYFEESAAEGTAGTVVVFMPKAKAELALRLKRAASMVRAGGQILLVGEKREGIAGAVKQLQALAPKAWKVDSARHCQVWLADMAATGAPLVQDDWLSWHTVDVAGTMVDVAGLPGIFSDGRLDDGTRMLLETLASDPLAGGSVLDFACGAGVIGGWLQARGFSGVVDGVDVQAQAVTCASQTYQRCGAAGEIMAGDGLDGVQGRYQSIVTNPPFHTGVRIDTSMTSRFLQQVSAHLNRGGELRLVANSFLPYEPLIREHVGPCDVIRQDKRFTVYRAHRH